MSREPDGRPPGGSAGPGEPEPPDPPGRVGTTTPGSVIGFALVGLVLGWLVRPMSVRISGSAPTVSWLPVLALAFVALIVGAVAWSTYRLLHRRHGRLEPHHAVNRLVLAKACALAGALVAGGYFGYALSWLASPTPRSPGSGCCTPCWPAWPAWPSSPGRCSWSARVGSARTTARPSLTTMASASPSSETVMSVVRPARRRQRSVRVSVAVLLLGLATVLVLVALPTQSPAWLSVAAVVALGCGWAAARIVYTEVVQSRRDAAADRAGQAQAYRSMYAERASEHAEFTTVMTDRLTRRDREVADLTTAVEQATRRAADAEATGSRADRAGRGAGGAERADELAVWEPSDPGAAAHDTVADLVAWEERVRSAASASTAAAAPRKHA